MNEPDGSGVRVRRIIVWALLTVTVVAAIVYGARRPLLIAVGGFLVEQDPPRSADAIVVLAGSLPDRVLEAVDLYQAHLAPRIVLTREEPLPGIAALRARGVALQEHHEQNFSVALQLGVPENALSIMPTASSSTFAEAQALVRYLAVLKVHSILLVTSKAHARRAGIIFRHLADGELQVSVCPSRYDPFGIDTWWQHRALVRRVVIEYGKLLTYILVDRWRSSGATP